MLKLILRQWYQQDQCVPHEQVNEDSGLTVTTPAQKATLQNAPSRRGNDEAEAVSAPSATKLQETRNKMPAASVYLLGNLHFSQFLLRIRCREVLS